MFRPALGPLSPGVRPLAALVLGLSLLFAPGGAVLGFEDDYDEEPAGGFGMYTATDRSRGEARPRPPLGLERPDRRERPHGETGEATLEDLYDDAMDDLAAGEFGSAERLFERLIAKAPDNPLAGKARRHLADLYAGHGVRSAAPPRPAAETIPTRAVVTEPRSERPEWVRGESADPAWLSPDTEMRFILDAGDRVFFSAGNSELGARAREVLSAQARWLKSHPDLQVAVEGHADDLPLGREQHASLAKARAEAVRQRLISEGVEPARIRIAAHGREARVSDCDRPECAAQNRRAVTVLTMGNSRRDSLGIDPHPVGVPVAAGVPGSRPR